MRATGLLVLLSLLPGMLLAACSRLAPADNGVDPGQPGPYAVGLAVRPFSRTLPNGETRTVDVYFRYPVTKQVGSSAAAPEITYSLAEPAAAGRPFPLVVFSHGSGASPLDYSNLLSHLASHGFVVAARYHRDCVGVCRQQPPGANAANRPPDVSMVLDTLEALDRSDDPVFRRLVDLERVGVAGHSFGGWTTLTVLERDSRFRAGLAMSPATLIQPAPDPGKLSRPVMLMAGVLDAMVPYALTSGFFAEISSSAPDHFLLAVQQAGHQFGNICIESFVTTRCSASMPQPQLQARANRIGTAFLLRYVAGHRSPSAESSLHLDTAEYAAVHGTPDRPAVAPTARPLASAAVPERPAGTVLLADDLTGAQGGALPASSPDPARYRAGYVGGRYEIGLEHAAAQSAVQGEVVLPGSYADASLAVDVELVDPTPARYVQLACRSQDATSQYRFAFRPASGELWIGRWLRKPDVSSQGLLVPTGTFSPAVHLGGAVNHAELSCRGATITARINGETVASASDNTFVAGQMWIAVGETPGGPAVGSRAAARFSNLVVTQE
jgi:dienelactone hydrolase